MTRTPGSASCHNPVADLLQLDDILQQADDFFFVIFNY
jgi:hypothetical protein